MSIIINALKKVEKQKAGIVHPIIEKQIPLKNRYWIDIIIVIIAATIIGTVMSTVFIKISNLPSKKETTSTIENPEKKTVKTEQEKNHKSIISALRKTLSLLIAPKENSKEKNNQPQTTIKKNIQTAATDPEGFSLSGIMWDSKKPIALINNQFLKENESINNATVVKINRSYVIIKINDQEYTLRIK